MYYAGNAANTASPPTGFTATKQLRTGFLKRVRIMRNVSTVAIQGGFLIAPQESGTDGKFFLGRFNGYCNVGGQSPAQTIPSYGVDEFLPSAGVLNNDLCYCTVEGPWLGTASLTAAELLGDSSGAGAPIQIGDVLENTTAAASTNTTNLATATCGRLCNLTLGTLTGKTLGFQILNRVGRALSSVTTNQTTGVPLLMYFTKF